LSAYSFLRIIIFQPTFQTFEFGTDVIGLFNDQLHDKKKQFVVAALVSVREIETTDLSIITAANLEFQSLHRSECR
jgi:hypothetical protein